MALIKRADADTFAREAVTLHLGDLQQEGETLIAEAKTRAEAILMKGRAERDRLVGGASERGYKAGFARGHAEGLAQGSEHGQAEALESTSAAVSALAEQWGLAVTRFEEQRERMISDARQDIVRLAAIFAEKVTRRAVGLDATVIERTLEAVVRRVVEPSALTVLVNPDDFELARRLLPDLLTRIGNSAHASVLPDESLARGGCVVRTSGGGVIDADVDSEIDRLVGLLLPAGEGRAKPEKATPAISEQTVADSGPADPAARPAVANPAGAAETAAPAADEAESRDVLEASPEEAPQAGPEAGSDAGPDEPDQPRTSAPGDEGGTPGGGA